MSKNFRLVMCLVLVSGFLAARPGVAWACSCAAPPSPEDGLVQATAVYSGRVKGIDQPWTLGLNRREPVRVTFDVDQVWKGPVRAQLVAWTTGGGASCGYVFDVGEEYLVYADGTEDELKVYLCSRTMPLLQAGEDLAALGVGVVPADAGPGIGQPLIPAVLLGVLALGLMLFVVRSSRAHGT